MLNKNFLAQHVGLEEAFACDHNIVRSIFDQFRVKGSLSDKQVALVLKLAGEANQPKEVLPPSEFQGTVGQRGYFTVRLLKVVMLHSYYDPAYGAKGEGELFMHLFRDEQGNDFKWTTGARLATVNGGTVEDGAVYRVKATVKKHVEYKGRKQTVINRVAIF